MIYIVRNVWATTFGTSKEPQASAYGAKSLAAGVAHKEGTRYILNEEAVFCALPFRFASPQTTVVAAVHSF